MHQKDADYIYDLTAALNAICNAIREYDTDFARITADVLRKQQEMLSSGNGRHMFQELIDVLEYDKAAGLQ